MQRMREAIADSRRFTPLWAGQERAGFALLRPKPGQEEPLAFQRRSAAAAARFWVMNNEFAKGCGRL